MIVANQNHRFETPDLGLAAYLIIKKVEYLGIRWPTPQQAVFTFKTPSDILLASWLKDDGEQFRLFRRAIEILRDDLLGAKR